MVNVNCKKTKNLFIASFHSNHKLQYHQSKITVFKTHNIKHVSLLNSQKMNQKCYSYTLL